MPVITGAAEYPQELERKIRDAVPSLIHQRYNAYDWFFHLRTLISFYGVCAAFLRAAPQGKRLFIQLQELVVTYVRWGERVCSPIIDKGQADVILSFELLEAALPRWGRGA
mgnify:CR=1 FL=1